MPVQLSSNRLISWALGLFTAYWTIGFLVDPLYYSVVISACLLIGGIMVAARAVPDAFHLMRKGQVGSGELAVIALALMSMGAVWTGIFSIVYAHYGRPLSLIGPFSAFGRAMIAVGFFMFFLSPEATRQGIIWPRWYILLTAGVLIAVFSFLIGYLASGMESSHLESLVHTVRSQFAGAILARAA